MVLNLYVVTPLASFIKLLSPKIITLWFITLTKLQLWTSRKNNLVLGVTTTWRILLKDHNIRKVENHRYKLSKSVQSGILPLSATSSECALWRYVTHHGTWVVMHYKCFQIYEIMQISICLLDFNMQIMPQSNNF